MTFNKRHLVFFFDLFGTCFDMTGFPQDELRRYVDHMQDIGHGKAEWTPFDFAAEEWLNLKPHADVKDGLQTLRNEGSFVMGLSNASAELSMYLFGKHGLPFHGFVGLESHKTNKPRRDAYQVAKDMAHGELFAYDMVMVTANPTFGDIEGSLRVGMTPMVIRQPGWPQTIVEMAEWLGY